MLEIVRVNNTRGARRILYVNYCQRVENNMLLRINQNDQSTHYSNNEMARRVFLYVFNLLLIFVVFLVILRD